VAVLACIAGVWYLLANDEDPLPPYDKVTTPVPIRAEFGKDMPAPPKLGKRLVAPAPPPPPEDAPGIPK
jgi:hypothetical protein